VKEPDSDDWKKLIRVLGYLRGTMELCLTIVCESIQKLTWYIDGSYATHDSFCPTGYYFLLVSSGIIQGDVCMA
jgi:hypothetical protein